MCISIQILTFTPENWNVPQSITVTPADDSLIDGDIQFEMIVEITAENSDPDFASVDSETVTGTVLDDDVPGFEITQNNTFVIVDENGTTDTFTIVLTSIILAGAIFSLYRALHLGPASIVAPIFSMNLVIAASIGFLILGEPFKFSYLIGIGLAVTALAFLIR